MQKEAAARKHLPVFSSSNDASELRLKHEERFGKLTLTSRYSAAAAA